MQEYGFSMARISRITIIRFRKSRSEKNQYFGIFYVVILSYGVDFCNGRDPETIKSRNPASSRMELFFIIFDSLQVPTIIIESSILNAAHFFNLPVFLIHTCLTSFEGLMFLMNITGNRKYQPEISLHTN